MKKNQQYRSFGEAVSPPPFYPDDPKAELEAVIGKELIIVDAVVVRDFQTELGKSNFALIRFVDPEDSALFGTTLCGGTVVVSKVQKAIDGNHLPLTGTITRVPSKVAGHSPYYDIN